MNKLTICMCQSIITNSLSYLIIDHRPLHDDQDSYLSSFPKAMRWHRKLPEVICILKQVVPSQ